MNQSRDDPSNRRISLIVEYLNKPQEGSADATGKGEQNADSEKEKQPESASAEKK
jgi:hypothetical protein